MAQNESVFKILFRTDTAAAFFIKPESADVHTVQDQMTPLTESFFSKINLHIIQCDADIQEHVKITKQEEFDEYLKNMKIHGLGGTDFRPVFELVDELKKGHEFTNLKGLIYFTDGFGEFPAKKPDYDTAFVFVDDEYNNPDVPPWAIKLVLQRDEI